MFLMFVGDGLPCMYVNQRTPISHPIPRERRANSHRLRQKFGDAGSDTVRMWLTEKGSNNFQEACRHKFRAKRSLYTEHELAVSQSITKQQRQFKAVESTSMTFRHDVWAPKRAIYFMVCRLSWLATTTAKLTHMPAGAVSDTTAIQTQHFNIRRHINHLSGNTTKRGTADHHPKGMYKCPPRQSLSFCSCVETQRFGIAHNHADRQELFKVNAARREEDTKKKYQAQWKSVFALLKLLEREGDRPLGAPPIRIAGGDRYC